MNRLLFVWIFAQRARVPARFICYSAEPAVPRATRQPDAFMSIQTLLKLLLVVVLLPLSLLQPTVARLEAFTGVEPRDAVSTRFSVPTVPPMNGVELFECGPAATAYPLIRTLMHGSR